MSTKIVVMSVVLVDEYKEKLGKLNKMIESYHFDYQPRSFCALTNTYVHSEECTCEHKQVCLRMQLSSLECIFGFHGIKPLADSMVEGVLKEFRVETKGKESFDNLWKALEYAKKMKEAMEMDVKEGCERYLEWNVKLRKQIESVCDAKYLRGECFDEPEYNAVDAHLEKELKKAWKRVDDLKQARSNAKMLSSVSDCIAKVDEMLCDCGRDVKRVKLEQQA